MPNVPNRVVEKKKSRFKIAAKRVTIDGLVDSSQNTRSLRGPVHDLKLSKPSDKLKCRKTTTHSPVRLRTLRVGRGWLNTVSQL